MELDNVYDLIEVKEENDKLKEEVERLNKLISQREKKWEKWTTEKQILSTKMSDYLCKYQNLKREYTKQIKISTDKKNEIERLNNIINELEKYLIEEIEDYDKHINSQYITDIAREQYEGEKVCFEDILGKLQELKGSGKE